MSVVLSLSLAGQRLPPPGQPGPWNQDILVYRVAADGRADHLATFPRAGVSTVARLADGRLIAAHQHFPEGSDADFDKVAVRFSSDEGRTWTGPTVIRLAGFPDDMRFPFDPTLVPLPDGRIRLYFTSVRGRRLDEDRPAIYSAISDNGLDFRVEPGVRFAVDGRMTIDCAVARHDDVFHLFVPDNGPWPPEGRGRAGPGGPAPRPPSGLGYHATSTDGLTFTRQADVRVDGRRNWLGAAVSDGGVLTFFGTGEGGLWRATSRDGAVWRLDPAPVGVPGADPGVVHLGDGAWLMTVTGAPRVRGSDDPTHFSQWRLPADRRCDLLSAMAIGHKRAGVLAAVDELAGLALGDARLNARARQVVAALERNPAAGFPAAVHTEAGREATYRLLSNRRVTLEGLLAPHVAQTVARAAQCGTRPLALIDKTEFVFTGPSERAGLTRLGPARHGFDALVGLAVTPTREPLGVVGIMPLPGHAGGTPAGTWARMVEAVETAVGTLQPIYVMDREADAYALVSTLTAAGRDFVIRISAERLVREPATAATELLQAVVTRRPVQLERTVQLARRAKGPRPRTSQQRHPPRAGRPARLTIRACPVLLARPKQLGRHLPATVAVHVVSVREEHPPADQPPVEWLLVTSLPIDTPDAVAEIVDHYRARWTIEEYFKALKSGCAYEKRQLESRPALLNALGLLAPLAWRLLALRTAAAEPDAPATTLLAPDELHLLRVLTRDRTLVGTPTASDALLAIARLGGHFSQNGRPGWKVLWIGWHKLLDRVEGYRLAQADRPARLPKDAM